MIEIRNLAKHYARASGLRSLFSATKGNETRAVDDISFALRRGEVLGLAGESGCGKSTTGRLIVGLEAPSAGTIHIDDEDALALRLKDRKAFHRNVQMVFQDPYGSLNPQHDVGEIVARPLRYQGERNPEIIRTLVRKTLMEVGLDPPEAYLDKHPHLLSGGQRQRVCIARAIILQPGILVADEPVSMLDVSIKWGIIRLLKRLVRERTIAMLYITHDLATVGAICDRLAIMYLGRIVEIGPTADVLNAPRHPYTQALIASIPSADPDHIRLPPTLLEGISDPQKRHAGCRFAPRCPRADARCRAQDPALLGEEHAVACFYAGPFLADPSLAGSPLAASPMAGA